MKRLLAITLVLLVYGVGFCSPPSRTAPMAPGVKEPGVAKNDDNQDVPHQGDDMLLIEGDDSLLVAVVVDSLKTDDDGSTSIVVVIMSREGSSKYNGAHRIAGRMHFKCKEGKHLNGDSYVIGDDGDIVGSIPADTNWLPTTEGTHAAVVAGLACGATHNTPSSETEL